MDQYDGDDGFFADLEKVAKALCVVTDQTSANELRRLIESAQSDGHDSQKAPLSQCPDQVT